MQPCLIRRKNNLQRTQRLPTLCWSNSQNWTRRLSPLKIPSHSKSSKFRLSSQLAWMLSWKTCRQKWMHTATTTLIKRSGKTTKKLWSVLSLCMPHLRVQSQRRYPLVMTVNQVFLQPRPFKMTCRLMRNSSMKILLAIMISHQSTSWALVALPKSLRSCASQIRSRLHSNSYRISRMNARSNLCTMKLLSWTCAQRMTLSSASMTSMNTKAAYGSLWKSWMML